MRNGVLGDVHLDHVLPRSLARLLNTLGHFLSLTESKPDTAFAVTAHDKSTEAETTPTFNHFRTTVDVDDFLKGILEFFSASRRRSIRTKDLLRALELVGLLLLSRRRFLRRSFFRGRSGSFLS